MKRGFLGVRGLWLVVVALVVGMQGGVLADARSDLDDATREFSNVTSHYNSAKQRLEDFLTASVRLRQFDQDQLKDLIRQICMLDMKQDGDNPSRVAEDMRDKAVERVKSSYNDAVNSGSNVFDDLGRLETEAKYARERAHKLEDQADVKSDAERLRQDIEKMQEAIVKLFERLASSASSRRSSSVEEKYPTHETGRRLGRCAGTEVGLRMVSRTR